MHGFARNVVDPTQIAKHRISDQQQVAYRLIPELRQLRRPQSDFPLDSFAQPNRRTPARS